MAPDRPHDLVLYGASGFVGRLTAAYLAAHAPAGVRVVLAGRSAAKLEALRQSLGAPAAGWDVAVAEAGDRGALDRLAASATSIATTVGPYARYGRDLLLACATAGTSYADLTGEVLFVRESIERAGPLAEASGARIVHSCGYDSVPSDLAVLLLHHRAVADGGGTDLAEAVLVASARGGLSGGTIDSLRAQMEAVDADAGLRAVLSDPYSLSADRAGEPDLGPQPDTWAPRRDPLLGEWTAPFVMGAFNTRIVRRSNSLSAWAYGRSLRYRETMSFGATPLGAALAAGVTGALAGLTAAMSHAPSRKLADRLLPAPGRGPSPATMERGWFRSVVHASTEGGRRYRATVAGRGDPGYKATALMLGETALALALDGDRLPDRAGVLTPATALGDVLVARLRVAGMQLDVAAA